MISVAPFVLIGLIDYVQASGRLLGQPDRLTDRGRHYEGQYTICVIDEDNTFLHTYTQSYRAYTI